MPVTRANQGVHTCPHCGNTNVNILRDSYYYSDQYAHCSSCTHDWRTCESVTHNDVMAETTRGHFACVGCLMRSRYRECQACHRYTTRPTRSVNADDETINTCQQCRNDNFPVNCNGCGVGLAESIAIRDVSSNEYCPNCRDTYLTECQSCHQLNVQHGAPCPCGETPVCDCYDCQWTRRQQVERSSSSYVHDYSYRPEANFHGKGPLFLGMELEMETGDFDDEAREVIKDSCTSDLCYLKSDGSINSGFELVTHPMSYSWALEHFPWEMLTSLKNAGASTHDKVGIHVHLSRKGFKSPTHIFKWMKFIYRNSAKVTRIAGRQSFEWASFDPDDRTNIKYYCKGQHGRARYRAVNTQNDQTFELRVFRSSLDPHEVKAFLGFADASVKYTRDLTATEILNGAWDWSSFYAWLADKPEYTDLRERMEELSCVS